MAVRSRKISEEEFHSRAIGIMERDHFGFYARYRELYKSVFLIPNAVISLALPDGKTLRVLMDQGQIMKVPRANSFAAAPWRTPRFSLLTMLRKTNVFGTTLWCGKRCTFDFTRDCGS